MYVHYVMIPGIQGAILLNYFVCHSVTTIWYRKISPINLFFYFPLERVIFVDKLYLLMFSRLCTINLDCNFSTFPFKYFYDIMTLIIAKFKGAREMFNCHEIKTVCQVKQTKL